MLVFVPLCLHNTCKDVFNPNVIIFQSDCAEGLHFYPFHNNFHRKFHRSQEFLSHTEAKAWTLSGVIIDYITDIFILNLIPKDAIQNANMSLVPVTSGHKLKCRTKI